MRIAHGSVVTMQPPLPANALRLLLAAATGIVALLTPRSLCAQTRIACLGDSITFGAGIADREHSSYPGWLNDFLGEEIEVRNFGVGGATLLQASDRPYAKTTEFQTALAWQPNVAVILLGTNDTCENEQRHNWQHAGSLAADAQRMIVLLRASQPSMRILLCSPTAMFADKPGLKPERQQDLMARAPRLATCARELQRVAAANQQVDYLELRTCLRQQDVSDGVHPSAFGAERIARRVAEAIASPLSQTSATRTKLLEQLENNGVTGRTDSFHDFEGISFALPISNASCRIFFPHGTARGTPWILRARFFGHQPALDLALLERGFHLVYCDVANLYGSPPGVERYRELHSLLDDAGFSQRAVLEGMSRGGLQILHWAMAQPQRVAAMYGDNPVVDIRSWPGGNGGKRSDADWQRCLQAYNLNEASAVNFEPPTTADLKPLAAEDIPMLLVLGMHDQVVPVAENGELLAQRYAAAGGRVELWRKPANGHHPHGLDPVEPLLRAILRATGFPQDITTKPTPSVEYRSGAGWNGDSWRMQVDKMRTLAKQHHEVPIAFLGDSITQGLTGASDRLAMADGKRAFDHAFGKLGAISLGLSGDRTEHILYRIQHGALQEFTPKVIVLQIGVNNVVAGKHTASEVLLGIGRIVSTLQTRSPTPQIVVCGPFPAGARESTTRQTIDAIHAGLPAALHGTTGSTQSGEPGDVIYLDLRELFLNADGSCNENMRGDRIHISQTGQQAWLQAVRPIIKAALQPR
jgi:lysophospholipase L1-like esterase/pimeloyl-ACP methyl ester carboxylesterase